jgi:hypothetical protein
MLLGLLTCRIWHACRAEQLEVKLHGTQVVRDDLQRKLAASQAELAAQQEAMVSVWE